jgi:hypothetical protein
MAVLPQFQGNMYDLQRQQMLAQALMQGAVTPAQTPQTTPVGPYAVTPKLSPIAPLGNLAQALMASRVGDQASQGLNNLGAAQWQALVGPNGTQGFGASSPQQPAPADQPANAGTAGATVSDGAAGSGGVSGQLSPAGQQGPQGMLAPGGPMNPLGMSTPQAAMMYLNAPEKYWEAQAQAFKPADINAQIRAAGIDPNSALGRSIAQNALAKAVAPDYASLRPGGYALNKTTGQIEQMPAAPEGYTAVQGPNGWQVVPVQGGLEAMGNSAAAAAGGKARYSLQQVWDRSTNGGKGGYVQQTVANVADAAGGTQPGAPAPLRNNNPGALMPGGRLAQYPDMQTGLQQMDSNLASYGKQGVNTLAGVISKWAPPNENNTKAYIQDVSQRLGIPPDQKIDLSNPAVRHIVSTGIMLHENGPQAFVGGSAGGPTAPMASQPPLGAQNAAEASQGAPSKQMADAYGSLSNSDSSYQQSREALTEMLDLAKNKGAVGTAVGVLPESISTKISPDAAKYQKLHATFVSLQGKALGGGATDAARATIDEAVPTYDKPQSAMMSGLQTQLNNLDMAHVKTQFLSPIYQKGDEKAFTQQSAAFDQNVKPSMVPALTLSGEAQRAAVQAAVKDNPSLRANFEWAFNNGLLK